MWRFLHHILLSSTLHSARTVPHMFSDVHLTCALVVTLPTYSRWLEVACKTAHAKPTDTKTKPQRCTLASSSTKTVPIGERKWSDIEPEDYSPVAFPVSKPLSTLLRHGHLPREDDGAIEFWRLKEYLWNDLVQSQHWSDEEWKSTMAKGGRNKKRFQYCTDSSAQEILYLRALQGHSGGNLIDPSLQDNVLIPNDFFEYIYHIGCAINSHSIMNSGLIPGGQILSKRQTVFFTSLDPLNKEHKDPDLDAPRLAWYKQKLWKKHQNTVYWVDINLAQKKGFKFYQTRSNAIIILHETLPAYCIPKAIMMGTGEITDRFIVDDDDMDSDTVAESDMSLKSRSFLQRVNDRVRNMQNQSSKDATQDSNKHSLIWRMFMSSTLEASIFMGKNSLDNLSSIKIQEKISQ